MNWLRVTVLAVVAATAAMAQMGPGMGQGGAQAGPQLNAIQQYLGLNADQMAQLESLRASAQEDLQPIMEEMRGQMQGGGEAGQMAKFQAQMNTVREKYKAAAVAVLNDAQKTKLAALEEAAKLMPAINGASSLNLLTGVNQGFGGRGGMMGGPAGAGQTGRPQRNR